jgi:23S rRNA-/tRNA-specific pseudouridylate synthase
MYLGITLGVLEAARGEWLWPISLDPRNPKLRIAGAGRAQRRACTRYEVAARTGGAALLRLMPRTGRTHQLRVHAAKAGAPLFGDHAYGGPRRETLPDGTVVSARRVMLHCARVSFPWPSGQPRRFESPVPADMQRVWLALGGSPSELVP